MYFLSGPCTICRRARHSAPPTGARRGRVPRPQAFLWGSLTGFAEPLGGLLGFLVLDQEEPLTFAVVFGLVAGIMAFVSFKELLPSAFRFDPADSVVSNSEHFWVCQDGLRVLLLALPLLTACLWGRVSLGRCCFSRHRCGGCSGSAAHPVAGIIAGMAVMAASLLLFTI